MAQYKWFHEEFNRANGFRYLPIIAQIGMQDGHRYSIDDLLAKILVNHVILPIVDQRNQLPQSYSLICLQIMGINSMQASEKLSNHRISDLGLTLLRILHTSIEIRNSRSGRATSYIFHPPDVHSSGWPFSGDLELHLFNFLLSISDNEWDAWITDLKVLIMGASLGGLKPGPAYGQNRFHRDPEGICGLV
jgi:hypothetical protein